jgi:hypothetical protein
MPVEVPPHNGHYEAAISGTVSLRGTSLQFSVIRHLLPYAPLEWDCPKSRSVPYELHRTGFHNTNTYVGQVSIPADGKWFTQRLGAVQKVAPKISGVRKSSNYILN